MIISIREYIDAIWEKAVTEAELKEKVDSAWIYNFDDIKWIDFSSFDSNDAEALYNLWYILQTKLIIESLIPDMKLDTLEFALSLCWSHFVISKAFYL